MNKRTPEGRNRRRKADRERYRRLYNSDPEFRARELKRRQDYYTAHRSADLARTKYWYEQNRERQAVTVSGDSGTSRRLSSLTRALRSGGIGVDEFNRLVSETLAHDAKKQQ